MLDALIREDFSEPNAVILTLNRPEKRNALNIELLEELCAALERAEQRGEERALILNAAGPVFCAGLDLAEGRDPERAERSGALVERALTQIYHSSLVTIACVQGAAVAGGAGLMSACDFVLAAPGSKIGYPETRRGLVAGLVMTFLKRQLRERDVRELLLLAELISAERAQEMGLINAVVEERQLLESAVDYAQKVAQNAPAATTMTKELLDQMYGRPVKMDLETAHSYHLKMRGTAEAQEGMQAFIEKRSPAWVAH